MPYRRKKLTFAISSPDEFLYPLLYKTLRTTHIILLPRDAMLARCFLWPSMCPTQAGIVQKWAWLTQDHANNADNGPGIDVKTFFTLFFLFWSRSYFVNVFYIKKRWQNKRVSKRKNGKEIIQFNNNNIFIFPVSYGSIEILKYCIQQTFIDFLNVDEKEKTCKILLCSSMQFC